MYGCDEDQHFGDYALDFMAGGSSQPTPLWLNTEGVLSVLPVFMMLWCVSADSPSMLESSLSPEDLPFHGCVIPPLTPQWDIPTEDGSLSCPNTDEEKPGPPSKVVAPEAPAGVDRCVNVVLRDTGQRQQEGTDALQEKKLHLRQLARRAKHLASVLDVRICWITSLKSALRLCILFLLFSSGADGRNREGADTTSAWRQTLAESPQAPAAGRGL